MNVLPCTTHEMALLGALLADPTQTHGLLLSPNDFSTPQGRSVFEAIRRVPNPTVQAVTGELEKQGAKVEKSFLSALFAVKDPAAAEDVEHYAAEVRTAGTTRRLKNKVQAALPLLERGDLQQATGQLQRALLDTSDELISGSDPTAQAIALRASEHDGEAEYFPSGLDKIDAATGGLRHKEVWVVAARSKGRKSTLALHMCKTVLEEGRSVAYIALEDDDVSFTHKLMAMAGDFNPFFFRVKPENRTPDMQTKMDAGAAWIADKRFRVYDAKHGVHRFQNIPSIIQGDKLKYGTDLVVVDYLQLFSEKFEDLADIAQSLQRLAQENNVCVLELSQMSLETLRHGAPPGVLATKGATSFGASCHVGITTRYDPERAPRKQNVVNYPIDLGSVAEIGVHMVLARNAASQWCFLQIAPDSGAVHAQTAVPTFPSSPGVID